MADSRITTQGFNRALEDLIAGRKLTRKAFSEGEYLKIEQDQDTDTPVIICYTGDGEAGEWTPTGEDLLAKDWYELT